MKRIRISAAGLAKIELDDKLLVYLNPKFLPKRRVYTPFGGSLQFHESSQKFFEKLGAIFERGNDIRMRIPKERVPDFGRWFYNREGREISPYRELREELVREEGILKHLPRGVVKLEYLFTAREVGVLTQSPGHEGQTTDRYLEVFRTKFNREYTGFIRRALALPGTHLALVTSQEIIMKQTSNGTEIGTNCEALISLVRRDYQEPL